MQVSLLQVTSTTASLTLSVVLALFSTSPLHVEVNRLCTLTAVTIFMIKSGPCSQGDATGRPAYKKAA